MAQVTVTEGAAGEVAQTRVPLIVSRAPRPTARYRRVSVPDDIEDPALVKASGRVVLPPHIHWSGDPVYDLRDRRDRKGGYRQALAEGLDDDVRYFIDVACLADLWDDMPLPAYVRDVWGPWLRERGWLD
ncbi:MAG: hypothetical protein OXD34_11455 [bacterium]|nr:hypothetical protein [bacterium]